MSIIRNSATAFAPSVVGIVFGIGTSIVTARVLGPSGRGVLSVALLAVAVLLLLSDAGMNSSLSYHVSKKRIDASQALGVSAYAAGVLGAVAIGASVLLWPVLADNILAGVESRVFFAAVAVLPAMLLANMWVRIHMALDRFAVAVRYQIAIAIGTFGSAVAVFLVARAGIFAYLLALAAVYWAVAVLLFAGSVARYGIALALPGRVVRSVTSYAARAYGGGVVNYALLRVDTFVLNAYAGSAAVGHYTMATTLMEKVWLIDTAAGQAALPQVVARERVEAGRLVAAVARNIVLLVGTAAVAFALVAPWLVTLLYGEAYLPAAQALRLLAPGVVAFAVSRILFSYHAAQLARPGTVSVVRGVMALLGILGYLTVIPRYGMTGAALTTSTIYVVSFLVALVMFRRASGVPLHEVLVPTAEDVGRYVRVVRTFVRRLRAARGTSSTAHVISPRPTAVKPMHVLVLCGGRGGRWGDYLGVPKHLVAIEGEKLLDRIVRQLRERCGEEARVLIVAPDERYAREGTQLHAPDTDDSRGDADKFLSSQALWNAHGRTVVLFGDVWYSDRAMDTILGFPANEWTVFGREGASMVTGKIWGELFAQSFFPADHERHQETLELVAEGYRRGAYEGQAGWRQYGVMTGGGPDGPFVARGRFVEIDDFTDDFDLPSEYEMWTQQRASVRGPATIEAVEGSGNAAVVELSAGAADLVARESSSGLVRRDVMETRDRLVRRLLKSRDSSGHVTLDAKDDHLTIAD